MIDTMRRLLGDTLQSLRVPMTPGQQQSALLLVPLTIALVFFGRPGESDIGTVPFAPPTPPAAVANPADELADVTPPAVELQPTSPPTTFGSLAIATRSAAPPAAGPSTNGGTATTPPGGAKVVAVVRPAATDDSATDAELAELFLTHRGVDAATVTLGGDGTCDEVLAAGSLVVAGSGLGPTLRSCLVEGGATIIAYDALGDVPPGTIGPGEVLSTRRGLTGALIELALRSRAAGRLDGATGLVTVESARAAVEAALPQLRAAGVDVQRVAYLPDAGSPVATSQGVLDFVGADVASTVFAAPVALQRDWVSQSSVVSPGMRYEVVDAFDAVLEGGYPDGFDGARTSTTVRLGWSLDPSPSRDACDSVWRDSGGEALSLGSRVRLYAWCQHAELASRVGPDSAGPAALRQATLDSPITTDLGPVGDVGWGPTQDVQLRWQAACTCWVRDGAPTDRTPHDRS